MVIVVCSCCYHPEVLSDEEYAKNSLSLNFVNKYGGRQSPTYFIIEVGDSPPIFTNQYGVKKLWHDFLLKMGYAWEETHPAHQDPITKEDINPLGWWHDPSNRKAKLRLV